MLKIFIIAFGGSIVLTWLAIIVARKLGILDQPDERKVHTKATPLLGGVAVFGAYVVALLSNFHFSYKLKCVVIASFVIMFAGLLDDVTEALSARARLGVQVLCALVVVHCGVYINVVPDALPFALFLEMLITVIWIVGITNAMNFLDGVDGLAAGLGLIASGAFFIIAYQTGQTYFAFLNIALASACAGFLFFNFNPAKIFLGDAGSSFIGFSLAALAVMGEWGHNRPIVALSIPLLILALLIFDMIYISVSRIASGRVRTFKEWIEYVGKDHLHHRLMKIGFTQKQTVLFIYLVNLVFAIGALVLKRATPFQAILLLLQGTLILIVVSILMIVGQKSFAKTKVLENKLRQTAEDIG